jgi:hypothetical protein
LGSSRSCTDRVQKMNFCHLRYSIRIWVSKRV